jgi:hypothetical protein
LEFICVKFLYGRNFSVGSGQSLRFLGRTKFQQKQVTVDTKSNEILSVSLVDVTLNFQIRKHKRNSLDGHSDQMCLIVLLVDTQFQLRFYLKLKSLGVVL